MDDNTRNTTRTVFAIENMFFLTLGECTHLMLTDARCALLTHCQRFNAVKNLRTKSDKLVDITTLEVRNTRREINAKHILTVNGEMI